MYLSREQGMPPYISCLSGIICIFKTKKCCSPRNAFKDYTSHIQTLPLQSTTAVLLPVTHGVRNIEFASNTTAQRGTTSVLNRYVKKKTPEVTYFLWIRITPLHS